MEKVWVSVGCSLIVQLLFSMRVVYFTICIFLMPPAFAAPPIPFDSWGGNGNIRATCPSGFTCSDNVVSENMLQRILTRNNSNETYIQLILQDGAVNNTGQFRAESFTSSSNAQGGIAAKITINQAGVENLDYTTILNLGFANSPGTPAIDLNQTITDNYQGVGFEYDFYYQQRQNIQGAATGYNYGILQRVTNSSVLNGSNSGGQDIHTFVLRRAGGDYTSAGSATLPSAAGMGGMGGGGGGGMGGITAPAPAPAPVAGGGTAPAPVAPAPAPPATGGGMMGRALSTRALSFGRSAGTTVSVTNTDFVPPPNGFGLGSGAPAGDPQTAPPDGTEFGPINNNLTPNLGPFPGSVANNDNTLTDNQNNNIGNDRNFAGGAVTSDGNASGPAAPTGPVTAPTGNPNGMGMGGGPAGGTVSWAAGNEVQVIWIGQSCPGCVIAGGMGGMGGGAGVFSFQQYENLSTGAMAQTRSITGTSPFTWSNPPFGPQPGL